MRWERRPRDITLSKLAKIVTMFLKENGLYTKYYRWFCSNFYYKKYVATKNGYVEYLRDRINEEGYIMFDEEIVLEPYFVRNILFSNYVVSVITGYHSFSDIRLFHEYLELHLKKLGYLNGKIILNE